MIVIDDWNRATWQQRLVDAETALHKLRTGTLAVELSADGETVKFTPSSEGKLMRYIGEIRAALDGKRQRSPSRGVSYR